MTSEAVVEEVGARFSGQASCSTLNVEIDLGGLASGESGLPVRLISWMPRRLISGSRVTISAVRAGVRQGQDDIVAGDHAHVAVAGFGRMHEKAGVPVLARAAILLPICPDCPCRPRPPGPCWPDQLAGLDEITVDAGQQCLHGLEFQAHGALGGLDQLAGLAHVENAMPDEKAAIIAAM
jgi:hypothetical protein